MPNSEEYAKELLELEIKTMNRRFKQSQKKFK